VNNLADGANPLTFSWNPFDANGGGIGHASGRAICDVHHDARRFCKRHVGELHHQRGWNHSGDVQQWQTSALGQIALASFQNDQGLYGMARMNFWRAWLPAKRTLARRAPVDEELFPAAHWNSPTWILRRSLRN